jgi:hypothetical protein
MHRNKTAGDIPSGERMWRSGFEAAKQDIAEFGEAYAIRVPNNSDNPEWLRGYLHALSPDGFDKAVRRLHNLIPGTPDPDPGKRPSWDGPSKKLWHSSKIAAPRIARIPQAYRRELMDIASWAGQNKYSFNEVIVELARQGIEPEPEEMEGLEEAYRAARWPRAKAAMYWSDK